MSNMKPTNAAMSTSVATAPNPAVWRRANSFTW